MCVPFLHRHLVGPELTLCALAYLCAESRPPNPRRRSVITPRPSAVVPSISAALRFLPLGWQVAVAHGLRRMAKGDDGESPDWCVTVSA